jgi:hypothetical protein
MRPRGSLQQNMNFDSPPFGKTENDRVLYDSYRLPEVSESHHPASPMGRADAFLAQPPVPEYVGMGYQAAADVDHQSMYHQIDNPAVPIWSPGMIDDLTTEAFEVSYDSGRTPIINVLDHDAQHDRDDGQYGDFDTEGPSHGDVEHIAEDNLEAFNGSPSITDERTSQDYHHRMIMPHHMSPLEPWTTLTRSFQDPTDAGQFMSDPTCPASYTDSPVMPHQRGYPVPQAPHPQQGLCFPTNADNATLAQHCYTPANFFNGRHRASDFSSSSLSPYHHRGNSVVVTPPESRSAEVDNRDT